MGDEMKGGVGRGFSYVMGIRVIEKEFLYRVYLIYLAFTVYRTEGDC